MSKYRYQREFLFAQRKIDEVTRFLKDKPNTDLSQVMDDKNNTVLHQCSYQGSLIVMKEYVNFMRIYWRNNSNSKQTVSHEADVKYRIQRWVNQKNKQGFTCVHYAAFKGQIEILKYLDELGADIKIKTNSGLGMLHLASQGDKVKTFVYYRGRLDINEPDERKSTPLHWAAFSGSEIVAEYLLAQPNIELNIQDVQQQTPLHLATIQGNTKIIRKLLIAGANRHIKNDKGEEPLAIAQMNDFVNTQLLLNDNYTCMDHLKFFFNLKIKYQPKKRSLKIPMVFIFLSIILVGSISYSLQYHDEYRIIFYIQQGLFGLLLLLYLSLVLPSPKMRKGSYEGLKNLWLNKKDNDSNISSATEILSSSMLSYSYLNKDISSICIRCVQYKPARSNHCDVCGTCIQQYDHHCPWINNCVGRHNVVRFNMFLILLAIVLLWVIVIGVQFVLVLVHDEEDSLAFFQINPELHDNLPFLFGFVFIAFTLGLVFFVPLLLLIVVNIGNLFIGKTTYERFARPSRSSVLSRSQQQFRGSRSRENNSKRGKVSCTNCAQMCIVQNDNEIERRNLLS